MKFQNITSQKQAKESIEAEQITVSPRDGYTPGAKEWHVRYGRWGHEYVIAQSSLDKNRYSIYSICRDISDIPFTIEFITEQKPESIVEVLWARKNSRTYQTEDKLKWTKAIALFASTLIQHGYCNN